MKELTKAHIGKRILIKRDAPYYTDPVEAGIMEISPSGNYLKIQFSRSDHTVYTEWVEKGTYVLIEELGSVMDSLTDAVEKFENFKKSLNKKKGKNKSYWEKDNTLPKPYQ